MKKSSISVVCAVCALCVAASCGLAMTKAEIDAEWKRMTELRVARSAGEEKAAAIRADLDARVSDGKFIALWKKCTDAGAGGEERLAAAWSVIKKYVPDGDVSRWSEVGYYEIPAMMLRPFMVIDALYAALIELERTDGGEWVAAGLLKDFSRSSHGRYDFLGECPAPVAEALARIVEKTGLMGNWKPRRTVGTLPLARPVRGSVNREMVGQKGMLFLNAAGVPASNGSYAWDREKGRFYHVVDPDDNYRIGK